MNIHSLEYTGHLCIQRGCIQSSLCLLDLQIVCFGHCKQVLPTFDDVCRLSDLLILSGCAVLMSRVSQDPTVTSEKRGFLLKQLDSNLKEGEKLEFHDVFFLLN